jgi:hypothetical protein
MTTKAAVDMYEKLMAKEKNRIKEAYREFLANFSCRGCPTQTDYMGLENKREKFRDFVMHKQVLSGMDPFKCELCHAFPVLMSDYHVGCPCLVLKCRKKAKRRLQKLVKSWE